MNLSPQKREHIRWFYRVGLSLLVPVLTFVLMYHTFRKYAVAM